MYISRIQLNPKKRETAKALQNREILHSAMERSINGDRPHILWRLEPNMSILAVSKDIPYLGDIQLLYGDDSVRPESKSYDDYLDTISSGNLMRFTVAVNPVINKKDGSKNGKDVPLNLRRTEKYPFSAEDWTRKKLNEYGTEVEEIKDINHETVFFYKNGIRIPIFIVTYAGIFRVKDPELVRKAMKTGIGGKKSYGCGLLTAVRIREI